MNATSILVIIARWMLGITFLIGACNGFLYVFNLPTFMPTHPEIISIFQGSDVLLFAHKSVELLCGLLLLLNRRVLLALIMLAPNVIGIMAAHAIYDPGFLPAAGLIFGLETYLLYVYGRRRLGGTIWRRNL